MKRLWLIFAALFFLSCGGSSSYIQAEVLVGIQMTQTAAANVQASAQSLPPPTAAASIPPPTATPAPLDLGAVKRVLLQSGRCAPAGERDCLWEHGAIYTCEHNGENLRKVIETGELLGVSADGRQALLSIPNPELSTSTLNLVDLTNFSSIPMAQNLHHAYACDGSRCSAVWLADGKIAYIGEGSAQNNQPNITLYLVNPDGTNAAPILTQAPTQPPLYIYRSNDAERIYWEAGDGAVPAGVFSMLVNGSDQRRESDAIDPAFSPAGGRIAFLDSANELGFQTAFFISSADWADPLLIYSPQVGEYVGQYGWSADGERLVFQVANCAGACTSKHFYWKTGATTLKELAAAIGFLAASPVWSADRRYVLYNSRDQASGKHTFSAVNTETFTVQPFLEKLALPEADLEVETFFLIP